jgi:hypothetical protein
MPLLQGITLVHSSFLINLITPSRSRPPRTAGCAWRGGLVLLFHITALWGWLFR